MNLSQRRLESLEMSAICYNEHLVAKERDKQGLNFQQFVFIKYT